MSEVLRTRSASTGLATQTRQHRFGAPPGLRSAQLSSTNGPPAPGGHSGSASASLVVPCDSFSTASRRSQRHGSDLHKKQLQGGFFRPPPAPGSTARILNDANSFVRLSAVAFEDEVAPAPPATLPKLRQAGRLYTQSAAHMRFRRGCITPQIGLLPQKRGLTRGSFSAKKQNFCGQRSGAEEMDAVQAFLMGMMVAWTPSLVLLAWLLRDAGTEV